MATVKPFRYALTKVSKTQLQLTEGLLRFLPQAGLKEDIQMAVRKALHQYLPDIAYYLEKIDEISFKDFYHSLSSSCCVGVLGLKPFNPKGFIEIDPVLSHLLIEKLLGGNEEGVHELRSLTETEQGVVEFLLLKLLAQIHKASGEKAKLHFRLEDMALEASQIRKFAKEEERLACLKFHVSFLKRSGFVHLYLPHPWVLEGFLKDQGFTEDVGDWSRYGDVTCELWGSLGQSQVGWADLENLAGGDVVLFDQTGIRKSGDHWEGEVALFVGRGEHGKWRASWDGFKENGRVRLKNNFS
ncbi:MAG: hypothetical protein HY609_00995 [Deltaproteobacteria bacterium]|nr:hypothetical protein [Deltaproteobacteria bacterium]